MIRRGKLPGLMGVLLCLQGVGAPPASSSPQPPERTRLPVVPQPFDGSLAPTEAGADGVILAAGSAFGGWSFYLDQDVPVAVASVSPLQGGQTRVAAEKALSPGRHRLGYAFQAVGDGGKLQITVDGEKWASGQVARRSQIMAVGGTCTAWVRLMAAMQRNRAPLPDWKPGWV